MLVLPPVAGTDTYMTPVMSFSVWHGKLCVGAVLLSSV